MAREYVIGQWHEDASGDIAPHIEVHSLHADFRAATRSCSQLPPGSYCLLSVLRKSFTVRESMRVVRNVVDWGESAHPRKAGAGRKGKGKGKGGKGKGTYRNGEAPQTALADEAPAF